jgi:hypothetical protein
MTKIKTKIYSFFFFNLILGGGGGGGGGEPSNAISLSYFTLVSFYDDVTLKSPLSL